MAKIEQQIEALKKVWFKYQNLQPADMYSWEVEKFRSLMKTNFICMCYKLGFSVSVIAYVVDLTEQSVYRRLRANPIYYEEMKALRKENEEKHQ